LQRLKEQIDDIEHLIVSSEKETKELWEENNYLEQFLVKNV